MTTTSVSTILLTGAIAGLIVVVVIVLVGRLAARSGLPGEAGLILPLLRDRDKHGMPSLAKFQLLLWTAIVSFAVLWVSFVRVFSGADARMPEIPTNLLGILGIGIITTPISAMVSAEKYPKLYGDKGNVVLSNDGEKPLKDRWSSMLLEPHLQNANVVHVPSLTRLQMLLWTLTGITIYGLVLLGRMSGTAILSATETVSIPDLSEVFVGLMGLSQVGHIGGKAALKVPSGK